MSRWAGRKVKRLTALVLANRGTVCHLCGEPGANSADHDPPRSELIAAGVPDPDALVYLWPAHLVCNLRRNSRPITPALRRELRGKRERDRRRAEANMSPRFVGRRR